MRELIDRFDHEDFIDDEHDWYYMSLNDYQETASEYNQYDNKIIYPVLGLTGEAGEVAEKVKKLIRNKNLPMDGEALSAAIGDPNLFVGNAPIQVRQVVDKIEAISKQYPDASCYQPESIL